MAIYRVLLDGVDIYDPTSKGMVLIDPVVHTEAGAAGNFEFTMPPMHVFYNNITPYGSSIEVLEDGDSIFFGRPLKPKIGFYNQKTYHCEGALAFLNDSRPTDEFVYENTTPAQYFRDLIAYHNSFQSKASRKFTIGNITVSTDWDVYREMSPSMTIMEHIKRGCVGSDGGYLFTRRVNGATYIDWMKDMPYTCNQTVEFSLNLLDMSRSGNEDIYTGVMLKGGERKIRQNGKISNSVVQYGPMWGSAEAIAKYGEIIAYQEYPDIDNVDNLIAAGEYFLMTQQFESMLFEVSAAEQHYLNVSLDAFEAGQKVHLVSNPHFVDVELPVQSIDVRLDSAEKKVTLGTVKRQTLTKIQRKMKEEQDKIAEDTDRVIGATDTIESNVDGMQSDIDDLFENQGIVIGDDGNPYTIGVDENGNVYAIKLDVDAISIAVLPDKLIYEPGEELDYTGIQVYLVCKGNIYKDSRYPTGLIPFEELSFIPEEMPDSAVATSDLDTGSFTQPIPITYRAQMTWTNKQYKQTEEYTWIFPHGGILMHSNNGSALMLASGKDENDVCIRKVNVVRDINTEKIKYITNDNITPVVSAGHLTHDGKTVYVAMPSYSSFPNAVHDPVVDGTYGDRYNVNTQLAAAWTVLYGELQGATRAITVSWTNPYNQQVLTAGFEVEYKNGHSNT